MATRAFRVAVRYAAKLDPERVKQVMLKLRKGAFTGINASQLGAVLETLGKGWKMEKIVGLVKLFDRTGSGRPESFFAEDPEEVRAKHRIYAQDAVTSLPTNPKVGKLYILDLTDPIPSHHGDLQFEMKPYMGSEGWKVTTSSGREQEFFPDNFGSAYHGYQPRTLKNVPIYTISMWLNKETDWLDQISTFLGLQSYEAEKREKSTPRTRENTGSCPVCFQNIKLTDNKMVLHGYKRPGYGEVHGRCYGVGYPAFELKRDGTEDYLKKQLKPTFVDTKELLKRLEADTVEFITLERGSKVEIIKRDDPRWKQALANEIRVKQHTLEALKEQIEAFTKLLAHWKERPLPKDGDPHIDWYFQGQTG